MIQSLERRFTPSILLGWWPGLAEPLERRTVARNLCHAPAMPSLLDGCLGANFEHEPDMARVLTGESVSVLIDSEDDLVAAREQGRALASKLKLSSTDIVRIATVISELARNVLVHARRGEIHFRAIDDGRKRGIVITAQDEGPGIERPDRAMQDGYPRRVDSVWDCQGSVG